MTTIGSRVTSVAKADIIFDSDRDRLLVPYEAKLSHTAAVTKEFASTMRKLG